MPMLIEHIDAIARQKQSGVLYVEFHPLARDEQEEKERSCEDAHAWKTLPVRQQIIDWLNAKGISWKPCGHFAQVFLAMGYKGQIYIDVHYDPSLPAYRELEAFLENPDGTIRYPEVVFGYCPLETAMKNVAHDEPGFWDKWTDDF